MRVCAVEQTCAAYGCECEVDVQSRYPVLVNSEAENDHVVRLAKRFFGPDKVGDRLLPMLAAEVPSHDPPHTHHRTHAHSPHTHSLLLVVVGNQDFAYYLEKKPGCFFFLGTQEEGRTNALNHSSDFEFNDSVIPSAVAFWIRLVEDRLNVSLFA